MSSPVDIRFPTPFHESLKPSIPRLQLETPLESINEKAWNELDRFYKDNKATIDKCIELDVEKVARSDKIGEVSLTLDALVNTVDVVLDGLVVLGNVHPILGVAIFAFHSVIKLDVARRDNNRKVLAVKLQMQNMMCSMFQLRALTHAHATDAAKAQQRAALQQVVTSIADDIRKCGSDLTYYMDRKAISKFINAKNYERRFADHIQTFVLRRSELQSVISAYSAAGIDAANIMLFSAHEKIDAISIKLDTMATSLFRKLDTSLEKEVSKFVEKNGGEAACIEKDNLLKELLAKTGNEIEDTQHQFSAQDGGQIFKLRQELMQDLDKHLDDALAKHLARFEKLLNVQNNNLERISDRMEEHGFIMKDHDLKLDKLVSASVLILEEGKTIKKAIMSNSTAKLKDPELQRIWDRMGVKSSVKAKVFVSTLRDYLLLDREHSIPGTPHTAFTLGPVPKFPDTAAATDPNLLNAEKDEPDSWVFDFIDIAHVQPIVEAMDEDGSGFISIKEANKFALSRPKDWSLLQWIAFWAAGWHISLTEYRTKIYRILYEMYESSQKSHPTNRNYVCYYLDFYYFRSIEGILRSIKPLEAPKEPRLLELVKSMSEIQEKRLSRNLEEISYVIDSQSVVSLVGGSSRPETWIMPLLYLVLKRHLSIIKIAETRVLNTDELPAHSSTIYYIHALFTTRMRTLQGIFKQVHRDVDTQFSIHAHGMFYQEYKEMSRSPSLSVLLKEGKTLTSTDPVMVSTDLSMLSKDKGVTFKMTEVQNERPTASSAYEPHPIEGLWTGVCLFDDLKRPYHGCFQACIGRISEDQFEGKGLCYTGLVEVAGRIEPLDANSGEPTTHINVTFKIKATGFLETECKGKFCIETRALQGTWITVHSKDTEPAQPKAEVFQETNPNGPDAPKNGAVDLLGDTEVVGNDSAEIQGTDASGACEQDNQNKDAERIADADADADAEQEAQNTGLDENIAGENKDQGQQAVAVAEDDENAEDKAERESITNAEEASEGGSYDSEDETPSFGGELYVTTGSPNIIRFRPLLECDDSSLGIIPSWSISRRRWAFAIEVVIFEVRSRLHSSTFFEERLNERRQWIDLYGHLCCEKWTSIPKTRGFFSAEQDKALSLLTWQIPPVNAMVYEAQGYYLFDRVYYFRGLYNCDACRQRIIFTKFLCVTCINENMTDHIDLCADCVDSRVPEDRFIHRASHSLLKTPLYFSRSEYSIILPQARVKSERVKAWFRASRTAHKDAGRPDRIKQGPVDGFNRDLGSESNTLRKREDDMAPLICVVCGEDVKLPCWTCVTCTLDILICNKCEQKQKPMRRGEGGLEIHSTNHKLLRIMDDVEVKATGGQMSPVERQVEAMGRSLTERLASFESNLENRVEERLNVLDSKVEKLESQLTRLLEAMERITGPIQTAPKDEEKIE